MHNWIAIQLFLIIALTFQVQPVPEQYLPFESYCQYFGYRTEQHQIVTQDGYILIYFRVQKHQFRQGLKPVYLQHGLIDSSDTFIINYQKQAPAFVLVDAGYDVWVGNARGNKYSKQHIKLNSNSREYWDFTWSEMADFDLPAGFKYIARVTGYDKIDYIGHSQGTLTMFAALSQKDETIEKYLGKFISLAPIVSVRHQQSTVFTSLSAIDKYLSFFDNLGVYQVSQDSKAGSHITATLCSIIPIICSFTLKLVSDIKPQIDNIERLPVVLGHYPAGSSIWDVSHFVQMSQYSEFILKRYDYGQNKNLLKYGSRLPPVYDLNNIKANLYIFSGEYDLLSDVQDVTNLIDLLKQNNPTLFSKSYEAGHATFVWGANDDILRDILSALQGNL